MIDEFPAFAVAAAFAQGESVVRDAAELRYKESDRIALLGQELKALGVLFDETPDGFGMRGAGPVLGGIVHAHGDHRLAMSLALAGMAASEPVTVQGTEVISESFPGFEDILRSLGADI
jgi:3-phosphoshikimate 1-carboxyvinyltransferase